MSDLNPCQNCLVYIKRDLKMCRKRPCDYHENRNVKALEAIIRKIMKWKKQTLFINSNDIFCREDLSKNYHGWSDPEHMRKCTESLMKMYHYVIRLSLIDDIHYEVNFPVEFMYSDLICEVCPSNDSLRECLKTKCIKHNTFEFKQLSTKLRSIQYSTENLKWLEDHSEPYTVQYHCANYDAIALNIFEYMEIDKPSGIETEREYLDRCLHSWEDVRDESISTGEYCRKCGTYRAGNYQDVKWEDNPDYGHLMTLKDFIESCECGGFVDYDGSAHYSDGKRMIRQYTQPSDIARNRIDYRFTHVMWFNK